MNLPDYLPPVAREIAEVIGMDGLLRLVEHYGGIVIRVPGNSGLNRVLTAEQYKAFVHTFRNEKLAIPRLYAKQTMIALEETKRLDEQGYTREEIARQLKLTERCVYKRLAKSRSNDDQQDLFE